jgi:hypothetical protein
MDHVICLTCHIALESWTLQWNPAFGAGQVTMLSRQTNFAMDTYVGEFLTFQLFLSLPEKSVATKHSDSAGLIYFRTLVLSYDYGCAIMTSRASVHVHCFLVSVPDFCAVLGYFGPRSFSTFHFAIFINIVSFLGKFMPCLEPVKTG